MSVNNAKKSNKSRNATWFVAILFVLVVLMNMSPGNEGSSLREYESARPSDNLPDGVLMDEREKALYDADPSSMGYTDEDREFLREHGVSEAEMRAAESAIGNPD